MVDEKTLNKLKKYAGSSISTLIIGIILIISGPIAFHLIYDLGYSIAWGLGFIICGIVMIVLYSENTKTLSLKLKKAEAEGNLPLLLNDFMNGGKAFDGRMILGQGYIIGKGYGTILAYYEIANVYQKINYTNGVENARTLMAVTTYGRTLNLCSLKIRGKSDDEFNHVISYILSMNPRIVVGYQGEQGRR